jgi:dipeptidyl-peptidase 4
MSESFPRQKANTRGFRLGAPRSFRLSADNNVVLFIRSESGRSAAGNLWCAQPESHNSPNWVERLIVDSSALATGDIPDHERARRERMREVTEGITAFSVDRSFSSVAFVVNGELYVAAIPKHPQEDIRPARYIATGGGCIDPQISPDGNFIAYVCNGGLHYVDIATGEVHVLAEPQADENTVTWGLADFAAAEELERMRGFWWHGDSRGVFVERVDNSPVEIAWITDPAHPTAEPRQHRYPFAGTANADVSLFSIDLQGDPTEIHWDKNLFPYLVTVTTAGSNPTFSVLSRDQTTLQINKIENSDSNVGNTGIQLVTHVEEPWHTVFPGVPRLSDSGSLIEIRPMNNDFRLCIDGEPVSPPGIQVNGVIDCGSDVAYTGCIDPTSQCIYTVDQGSVSPETGVHSAAIDQNLMVIASSALDSTSTHYTLRHVEQPEVVLHEFDNLAEHPIVQPNVTIALSGTHSLRSAIIWPENHVPGTKIPVICAPYGGPHAQRVIQAGIAFCSDQWLANHGFAVVITDNRGTPSRGPHFEYAVHHDLAHVVLDDQISALTDLGKKFPDLDLSRVGIHGWSFGGYLSALAVLLRPDIFHAAVAGAPVTDWALYDTAYSERYLGMPEHNPDVYAACSLLNKAPGLGSPLLMIHGLADDNVLAAHTLQLSSALLEAGKDHSVLPLSGVSHMTPQEVIAENLLLTELRFFQQHLSSP